MLGIAEWDGGTLTHAGLVKLRGRTLDALCKGAVPKRTHAIGYCESMHAYRKVPANDLIDVQTVGAVYVTRAAREVRFVRALDWKGNVPKDIHHKRIRKQLDSAETAVLEEALTKAPKGSHKEILDAVGIGLWAIGRQA